MKAYAVLAVRKTYCANCGTKYETPESVLKKIDTGTTRLWKTKDNPVGLQFEKVIISAEVPCCQLCAEAYFGERYSPDFEAREISERLKDVLIPLEIDF